jgi:hypothetical protein
MAPIRNYAVAQGVLTATGTTFVYTVPAGYALILKFGGVVNNAGAAATGQFGIHVQNTACSIPLASTSLQAYQAALWSGWTVLNASDQLYVNSDHQPTNYWFAGALLPFAVGVHTAGVEVPAPDLATASVEMGDSGLPLVVPPPIYLPPNQNPAYVAG